MDLELDENQRRRLADLLVADPLGWFGEEA